MSAIHVNHVTKRFGTTVAINNLNFQCEDGDFVVVLGKPGAGKSTLLKMLAGIEFPDEGTISFDGLSVNEVPPEKRKVAMAFETYALYPHMTVLDNLLSPLTSPNNTIDKGIRQVRIDEVSKLLEIDQLLNRKPSQLSGGQRQRVSLARALVKAEDASCVLLDEPISHLDARLRNSLRGELKKYLKGKGATVVYTTADYSEALGIADHVLVLIAGVARMFAPSVEVYSRPFDLSVADMIGDPKINFFDISEKGYVSIGERTFQPEQHLAEEIRTVGFRPMDIKITAIEVPEAIPGFIYVTEPIGYEQIVRVMVGPKIINVKQQLEGNSYSINQPVWLEPNWQNALQFDMDGILKGQNRDGDNHN